MGRPGYYSCMLRVQTFVSTSIVQVSILKYLPVLAGFIVFGI